MSTSSAARFVHQHAQRAGEEGVSRAVGYGGELVGGAHGQSGRSDIAPVPGPIMRPFQRRRRDAPSVSLCAHEGCSAFQTAKYPPWCAGHARSRGLWSPRDKTTILEDEGGSDAG